MNKKIILKLLRDHREGVVDNNRKLWALLFFDLWYNNINKLFTII